MVALEIGLTPRAQVGQEDGVQACVIGGGGSIRSPSDGPRGQWREPERGMIGAEKVLPLEALGVIGHPHLGQLGPHCLEGSGFVAEVLPGVSEDVLKRLVPVFPRPGGQEIAAALFALELVEELG